MTSTIRIQNRMVGQDQEPFVIAEMSGNHNQSLERAFAIVDAAAAAGAHAIKIQTYTADTLTIDCEQPDFRISDSGSLWKGNSLYQLYQQASTPWEWHLPIMARAKERGMICFSTPFDETSVDFLETLGVPAYKIASFENNHIPLIRKAASTGKPLLISTGMATVAELDEAVRAARSSGCSQLVLLKCTSTYPATPEHTNLLTIPHMGDLFGCPVGLSDHTLGIGVPVAAIALGAVAVEKHFTLSRADGGVDSAFSLEPAELAALVAETKRAWQSLGKVRYGAQETEKSSLKFRRSLYITENIRKGELFGPHNLRAIRPGYGLAPKYLELFLGKPAARDLRKGSAVTWDMLGFSEP